MGVQAFQYIGDKKSRTYAVVASGAALYPNLGEVSIVSILPVPDLHRSGEVQRAVMYCLEYARDNDLYNSSTSISVVTTLDGGKSAVRTETVAANVVTNDVGIMIVGSTRSEGGTNINYEAHRQLIDGSREDERLVA